MIDKHFKVGDLVELDSRHVCGYILEEYPGVMLVISVIDDYQFVLFSFDAYDFWYYETIINYKLCEG